MLNAYSDIPFYVQSLLSDEDDYGVVLLLTLTPRYVAPEEYANIFGMKIKKSGFKPIDWKNIVKSDLPRSKRTSLPWEVGTITSWGPLEYKVTREKAPLYEISQVDPLAYIRGRHESCNGTCEDEKAWDGEPIETIPPINANKWGLPILKADPPGGTLFHISSIERHPFSSPKSNIWNLLYDNVPGEKDQEDIQYLPRIDYIKTEIYLDTKLEIPVETIDITFNIEKEETDDT